MNVNPLFSTLEQKYALPQGYLNRTYGIESNYGQNTGSNPNVQGPFQFTTGTAKQYGLTDPNDLTQSADAAARLAADNTARLRSVLGRDPTGAELYLAHQQGAGGAVGLLANPDAPAGAVTNPAFIRANGGDPSASAADFINKWASKYDGSGTANAGVGSVSGPLSYADLAPPADSPPPAAPTPAEDKQAQGLLDKGTKEIKDALKPKTIPDDGTDPLSDLNKFMAAHAQAIAAMRARARRV